MFWLLCSIKNATAHMVMVIWKLAVVWRYAHSKESCCTRRASTGKRQLAGVSRVKLPLIKRRRVTREYSSYTCECHAALRNYVWSRERETERQKREERREKREESREKERERETEREIERERERERQRTEERAERETSKILNHFASCGTFAPMSI